MNVAYKGMLLVPLSLIWLKDPTEYDQISTLPNGLRVATEALPGPFSGIGVYLDAGSRYENEELCGVSHIVDRLAFKVCGKSRTQDPNELMRSQ